MPDPAVNDSHEDPSIEVLHEDCHWLGLDLPVGWPGAISDRDRPSGEIERALRRVLSNEPAFEGRAPESLRLVYRPEAGASGVALVAKSTEAANCWSRLENDRRTLREYLVLVGGKPPRRAWTCCLKVRPDPERRDRVLAHTTMGQHAETEFEVLGRGEGLVLLVARPRTQRAHQVRVHLASAGLPVVGDTGYGFGREIVGRARRVHVLAEGRGTEARRAEPLAMRAVSLGFVCPLTRNPIEITAPVGAFLEQYGFSLPEDEGGESAPLSPGAEVS